MTTIYFVGLPIAAIVGAAVDPQRYGENYIFRGLIGFLCGCFWPIIAAFFAITGLLGLLGLGGERLRELVEARLQ